MKEIRQWQIDIHEYAKSKGWWEKERKVPELLMLIVSELAEALEGYRNHNDANFREEIADAIIRIFDMCEFFQIDLEKEIAKKHEYNLTRPYRHGNKRC